MVIKLIMEYGGLNCRGDETSIQNCIVFLDILHPRGTHN